MKYFYKWCQKNSNMKRYNQKILIRDNGFVHKIKFQNKIGKYTNLKMIKTINSEKKLKIYRNQTRKILLKDISKINN